MIIGLFFSGSPLTVFRTISSVIINSFNSEATRHFAHILVEIKKAFPSLTNRYSPTTIPMKPRIFITATPIVHIGPALVCRSIRKPVLYNRLSSNAPTGSRFVTSKVRYLYELFYFFFTLTLTKNTGFISNSFCYLTYNQPSSFHVTHRSALTCRRSI